MYTQLETNGSSSAGTNYDAIAKLTEFKTPIANAITEMGVKTSSESDTNTMVNNIKKISLNNKVDSFVPISNWTSTFIVSGNHDYIIFYSRYQNITITRSIGDVSDIQYLFSNEGGHAVFFIKNVKNNETFINTTGSWIQYAYPVNN